MVKGDLELFVRLAIGFLMVFGSLACLQLICRAMEVAVRGLQRVMPSLREQETPAKVSPRSSEPLPKAAPVEEVVPETLLMDLPRTTLVAIIQDAVQQTFPGRKIRILSYGLPRSGEAGSAWAQLGRQRHFESHKIR